MQVLPRQLRLLLRPAARALSSTSSTSSSPPAATAAATAAAASVVEVDSDSALLNSPIPPHLAIKEILRNPQSAACNVALRKVDANIERIVELSKAHTDLVRTRQLLEQERNSVSQQQRTAGNTNERLRDKARELKHCISETKKHVNKVQLELYREALRVPNWQHPDAPEGPQENAVELKTVGTKRQFDFKPRSHVELGAGLDWFDFESASAACGPRFSYLKHEAVLLEMALMSWSMGELCKRGFGAVAPPVMVAPHIIERCGFQPRSTSSGVYHVADSSLCLTGTSEVGLAALLLDRIVRQDKLPLRMAGSSVCFRTEAGAGRAVAGIYRQHQFNKVEMFVACEPQQSEALHQQLLDVQIELCAALGLHARILDMPSEELGASAFRKFDIEAWMPGRDPEFYGEIMSTSNCTDFQSRRFNARTKDASGRVFLHTLNGTACAVPRMLISIMEQMQQADGSIEIPVVLRPFMNGIERVQPRHST